MYYRKLSNYADDGEDRYPTTFAPARPNRCPRSRLGYDCAGAVLGALCDRQNELEASGWNCAVVLPGGKKDFYGDPVPVYDD